LKSLGYDISKIPFIPVSAWTGDNLIERSPNMPWYDGPTLVEALDMLEPPPKPVDKPLRIPIQDVYAISGVGTVPVGRVETGRMKVGDKIIAVPAREGKGVVGEVKSIEMHHEQVQVAEPGDNIGFNVRGIGKKDIARGDVIGHPDNPPTVAEEFTAQIVILNHPTVVTTGYTPVFHIHTAQVACTFIEIQKKLNPATGEVLEENPDFLRNGDVAIVKLRPVQATVIEKQSDIPQLSRFAIRDSGTTVAAGMCIDIKEKPLQ
jgi:elongation factor 1-alpha